MNYITHVIGKYLDGDIRGGRQLRDKYASAAINDYEQLVFSHDQACTDRDNLIAAILRIFAEPQGCSLCDCGVPRNPEKGHQPDCPYELARLAVKNVPGHTLSDN